MGPCSSSYEMNDDANPIYRNYCSSLLPSPPLRLKALAYPLLFISNNLVYIFIIFILGAMLNDATDNHWYLPIDSMRTIALWFIQPERFKYLIYLRLVYVFMPLVTLLIAIISKRIIIGRFTEGSLKRNDDNKALNYWNSYDWRSFQRWLMV